jgi:hypothetical protein
MIVSTFSTFYTSKTMAASSATQVAKWYLLSKDFIPLRIGMKVKKDADVSYATARKSIRLRIPHKQISTIHHGGYYEWSDEQRQE